MSSDIEERVREILEKELYGYSEGCVGTMCSFTVRGYEKAVSQISELVRQAVKEAQSG